MRGKALYQYAGATRWGHQRKEPVCAGQEAVHQCASMTVSRAPEQWNAWFDLRAFVVEARSLCMKSTVFGVTNTHDAQVMRRPAWKESAAMCDRDDLEQTEDLKNNSCGGAFGIQRLCICAPDRHLGACLWSAGGRVVVGWVAGHSETNRPTLYYACHRLSVSSMLQQRCLPVLKTVASVSFHISGEEDGKVYQES